MNTSSKILVVDDEPSLLNSWTRILSKREYAITTATCYTEAITQVRSNSFDVIVSDVHMPEMNGFAFMDVLRQYNEDVPVVFVTGNINFYSAVKAIEYGVFRFLVKPVLPEDLFGTLDKALRAHERSRTRQRALEFVSAFEPEPENVLELKSRFSEALEKIWMAYQPIVSWADRRVVGYEALLRSEEESFINPLQFIRMAERLKRVKDIGRTVRDQVAKRVSNLPSGVHIFNNIHPHDLEDLDLYTPDAPLSSSADQVVIEITERTALGNIQNLSDKVTALRELGFKLAIDDLGAGYSGLSSLIDIEPDIAKIDMSLIRDIHREKNKQRIVLSMIQLCKELNITTISEGVETREELNCLVDLGCDLFQGYLFATPAREFAEPRWLAA